MAGAGAGRAPSPGSPGSPLPTHWPVFPAPGCPGLVSALQQGGRKLVGRRLIPTRGGVSRSCLAWPHPLGSGAAEALIKPTGVLSVRRKRVGIPAGPQPCPPSPPGAQRMITEPCRCQMHGVSMAPRTNDHKSGCLNQCTFISSRLQGQRASPVGWASCGRPHTAEVKVLQLNQGRPTLVFFQAVGRIQFLAGAWLRPRPLHRQRQ